MSYLKRILLVEDEPNLGSVLKDYLELSGFEVTWRLDGKKGWSTFKTGQFDLCILDVMMPEMDGFTLGKEIRKANEDIPIMFLTARGQKQDIMEGYNTGADDYITKPFDSELLILKINALLRRKEVSQLQELSYTIGKYSFDSKFRQLVIGDSVKKLSPKEASLLQLLCEYKDDILPRKRALEMIWKEDSYFTKRSMDVYITKLRKYLAADDQIEIINIHSNGYMLKTV
ncbi:MAG: DNA-binding response regulator [Crocinitomicaceae bacterium]|nr:DNA-binding response regulator [Crocinitomicaceae bacterium]|tara:strand:- start:39525 stop:40211 length:687 start_codon:yes stop_codon:yes gene_type:complete